MKDFIICKPLFVRRKRVVVPCVPVIPSRRVEGTYRIYLQSFESITNYNPADEGCTCRRNVTKDSPNDRAQQHRRPGFSTITPRIPQLTVFFLITTHLFLITLLSYCCTTDFLRKNKTIFVIFGLKPP